MIITLCGSKNSGKDTVADYFVSKYGFKKISFAETLKDMLSILFRWDRKILEGNNIKNREIREEEDSWWTERLGRPVVPRIMMQQFGTKIVREINPDIFIYNLEQRINEILDQVILPVHVAAPLNRIVQSANYFKKLHLISDVLLGSFRLYGHAIIQIAKVENAITDALELSIDTLLSKDSHGLWSNTIAKLIQELDKVKSPLLSPEIASAFGVAIKSKPQPNIKKMTIRNTVIDGKGQKQFVEVSHT
jgi:hypothetical protein